MTERKTSPRKTSPRKTSPRKRATTIAGYQAITRQLFASHGRQPHAYRPRPDDIIITPFSKSGTTWLQQIFHTLRTRGDMDFTDISGVVPWIETSAVLGIDLNASQRGKPRGYKSHLPWDKIPRGARYINAVRHPNDVAWSLFKFMEGWFIEPGAISPDDFVRALFLDSGDYYHHLNSWWAHRQDDNVLYLAFEQMTEDLEGTIRRVAAFSDIALDDELLTLTLEHASLSFMQTHKDRFDDALLRDLSERELLPPGSDSAKVREGKVGGHRDRLSADILAELDAKWQTLVTPTLGFNTYEELLAAI